MMMATAIPDSLRMASSSDRTSRVSASNANFKRNQTFTLPLKRVFSRSMIFSENRFPLFGIMLLILTAAAFTKGLRRHAGLLAEKSGEVRRIGKRQIVGNLVDRLIGEHQLALGFGQYALADQMARRHAGRALDVVVEPVGGPRQILGLEADQPFLAEMLVHQPAPFLP